MRIHNSARGFGLVEIVVASAVLATALLGISTFFQVTLHTSATTQSAVQGDYLLEEGVETVKLFRDMSYTNNILKLSTTTTYYFLWNGTNWATSTTDVYVDGRFDRSFTVTDVKRDTNDDITTGTGAYDPNTKLVTVTVAWWNQSATTTRSIATYLTNLFTN